MNARLTTHERDLLRHAIGVQKRGKRWTAPYRNHFVAAGENVAAWERLVSLGLATRGRVEEELLSLADPLFHVTDAGRDAALAGLPKPNGRRLLPQPQPERAAK